MSFSSQLAGSASLDKYSVNDTEVPSAGGTIQKSCYSIVGKISALTNPVSLQHDVMYANAFAAVIERNELSENETPLALGCVGHQPDREFPLESKTTVPLPLIMYPTETCGNTLDKMDMCALPVLNWEKYIQTIKVPRKSVKSMEKRNTNHPELDEEETEHTSSIPQEQETLQQSADLDSLIAIEGVSDIVFEPNTFTNTLQTQSNVKRIKIVPEQDNSNHSSNSDNLKKKTTRPKITRNFKMEKILNAPLLKEEDEFENMLSKKCLNKIFARKQRCREPKGNENKLNLSSLIKLKCQPKLRIEGTWNHLYGGYNGACCFMEDKTSKKLCLFLGKGSLLRAVELKKASPSSIFSYTVESIWDEDPVSSSDSNSDPFDELIFQLVPNEDNNLLGLRRGRTIQIYNTDGDIPDLLETVPNTSYGASKYYYNARIHEPKKTYSQNPLLRGFDFNPTFGPEVISIDENQVVRVCNIHERTISEQFRLPSSEYVPTPKNYPDFKINDAVGITFANNNHLFYAWGNSLVYMGDRRSKKYSRSHIFPLFDVRNHVHSVALSSQNYFHQATTRLNEYMSCVRRSKRDPYYYVGTTMKIYFMDLRVPTHPVIAVNHGLQSPLTYMDTYSGSEENFETIVAGSQRSSETACMISDFAHIECLRRPGCKSRNPLLYSYPRHLLNPKSYFDSVVNEGYDFPHPADFELVKNHFYAWSTGLAIFPLDSRDNFMHPAPMIVTSCNNFGDVFWQEWDQKPIQSHRKYNLTHYKLKPFLAEWHKEMKKPESDMGQKASKNPMEPVDCTIILEPLAKEIEKLTKVRDSPFDCFKPSQVLNYVNRETMIPMNKLCDKLREYKSPQVKGILDVWCTRENEIPEIIALEAEQAEIKIEPPDHPESHSPANTIDIIDSDDESSGEEQALTGNLAQIELEIQNSLNLESGGNLENFMSTEGRCWSGGYTDIVESSFPFNPIYGTQDLYDNDIPHSSSQQPVKRTQKKPKKSGF